MIQVKQMQTAVLEKRARLEDSGRQRRTYPLSSLQHLDTIVPSLIPMFRVSLLLLVRELPSPVISGIPRWGFTSELTTRLRHCLFKRLIPHKFDLSRGYTFFCTQNSGTTDILRQILSTTKTTFGRLPASSVTPVLSAFLSITWKL